MTNETKYAIFYLTDNGESPTKISKELSIPVKDIKSVLSEREKKSDNTTIKTTSAPVNSKNLMITETSVKGTKSVAIMTKEASSVNDEFRKNITGDTKSRTAKNAIYRPNNK